MQTSTKCKWVRRDSKLDYFDKTIRNKRPGRRKYMSLRNRKFRRESKQIKCEN